MTICILSLGSNLKNPQKQILLAIKSVKTFPRTNFICYTKLFKNKAIGKKQQPDFINTLVCLSTYLKPHLLLMLCQDTENLHGRYRREKYGARTLDIDIIFYGDLKLNHPKLIIPHPRWQTRQFITKPLKDIQLLKKINHNFISNIYQKIRVNGSTY